MKKVAVLQSGFLSLSDVGLVQTEPLQEDKVIRSLQLGKPVDNNGNAFFYSKDIEELFKLYNSDHRVMASFSFRENFLAATKVAFGTPSFLGWATIQQNSPYLTTIHRKFLNDTFNFISTGRREVNIESWMGLVNPREATAMDKQIPVELSSYFSSANGTPALPEKLSALIAQWTGQTNGFNDLMFFMALVFSKQTLFNI